MTIAHLFTLFIIGSVPVVFAAVQPWVWALYGIFILAAFLALFWSSAIRLDLFDDIVINLALLLFFSATLFLCVPLPTLFLSFLSPFRLEVLDIAQTLVDSPERWQTLSYSPKIAFSWWTFLLLLYLFFVTVRNQLSRPDNLKRVVSVMLGVGLIEACYGLVQALVPTLGVLWVDYIQAYMGDARGTFINRNHFAGFIEMVWPLALGFTLAQGGWGQGCTLKKILASESLNRQALSAFGIVLLLLALLFSRSRAGIAGAAIGFLSFIMLAGVGRRRLSRYTWFVLMGIVVLLGAYTFAIGVDSIADRFFNFGEGNSRMDFWRDSLPIIKDHPFGIGLRNFEKVFPVYNASNLSHNIVVDYAHNDYLQLLIEAGWIGFLSVICGFTIFMWKSASRIRHLDSHREPMRFFCAVGAFSGLASMTFHSFFDFNLQIPANCVYFVALIAILHACCVHRNHNAELKARNSKLRD